MDETAVWFNMVGFTTVETRGARSVLLKTTDEPLDCGSGCKSGRDQTETFCGFQRRCQGSQGDAKHQWSGDSLL